jgi:hypothetical protein
MGWSGFIVRPFGKRPVQLKDGGPFEVDFEAIERLLIAPAMVRAGIAGSTTQDILAAGNIREDMFQLLAHADVVIADISLHNANVFYELGARHALRDRRTFLIRFATVDDVPFDIKTDRYLSYDPRTPEAAVEALAAGLLATLAERQRVDSPIFNLLPALRPPSVADLVPVPADFRDELAQALALRQIGHLVLLGLEADQLPWGAEGLRLVGRALRSLGANAFARDAFEALRNRLDRDLEADLRLATLYQKLGNLAASDSAIERALSDPALGARQRAEALSLRASNAKTRWLTGWRQLPVAQAVPRALQSPSLSQACDDYAAAFASDLNHFYSGVNALALARIRLELAQAAPQAWSDAFDTDEEATAALQALNHALGDLAGAVTLSVQGEARRTEVGSSDERWMRCTAADVRLLRKERLTRVVAGYRHALEGADADIFDSVGRQWQIYQQLGLFADVMAELTPLLSDLAPTAPEADGSSGAPPERLILFAGHRIDEPGRQQPRFPADREPQAAQAIAAQLQAILASWPAGTRVRGLTGGASGGDILFHEACHALGIPTAMYLPMPADAYVRHSVAVRDTPSWIERFHTIRQRCDAAGLLRQLGDSEALPAWLARLKGYNFWERNNRWLLRSGLALGGERLRLLVLWDGDAGDGRGGTHHLMAMATEAGAACSHIDTRALFGLPALQSAKTAPAGA